MSDLALVARSLPPCTQSDLKVVEEIRERIGELEPVEVPTEGFFHAGTYVRSCLLKKGAVMSGAVIKVPTVLIVSGDCLMTVGSLVTHIQGYAVLRGEPGRSQVFRAFEDTFLTMFFATDAKTEDEAEREFTDEFDQLLSRRQTK